ncbi:LysM peptidoglycan-binding domain-containing protein [Paenibacillus sanguinis]|uniref:LysM peptidoglycan-binding domain-containing protein n=1 Tax=Paenibacillus sanguinis TaxID=225906 RepID=UPI00036E9C59|nr:LysM peptidoglycan-binding domain-containing protein [Paenibacillus sanguinis]
MSMEFWLSYNNNAERLQLPVNPEEITIGNSSQTEVVNVSGIGEVAIINDPVLKTFDFSSQFPSSWGPYCAYKDIPDPKAAAATISRWKATGKPIRFLVTETTWNFAVTIEDYTYREVAGDVGTIYFDLSLREYKFIKIRKLETKTTAAGTTSASVSSASARPSERVTPATYTVRSGDSLWKIGQSHGVAWQTLAKLNGIRAPYVIRPGQVVKLK